MSEWTNHVMRWKDCTKCPLHKQRDRICLARGQVPADVLFIGEAPGASEDALGQPFVGPAGALLNQIIERAIPKVDSVNEDYKPEWYYAYTWALTNLVCCFPREAKERGENEPEDEEILACRPRLVEFINIVQPRLIVCVGSLAAEYVNHEAGTKCVDIIHPAATFPPRMVRAQAQQAIQRAIVVIRSAVDDMLTSEYKPFVKWKVEDAEVKSKRQRLREAVNEADIPF